MVIFATPGSLNAHSNQHLAKMKAEHGGVLRMHGPYHMELVVKDGQVDLWLTNHANVPQPVTDAKGRLIVMTNGRRHSIELLPAGLNRLHGANSALRANQGMGGIVELDMKGRERMKVRFFQGSE